MKPFDRKYRKSKYDENRKLMPIELKIIRLVSTGLTNEGIAKTLRASRSAIKYRLTSAYDKLGLGNRVELALWYVTKYEKVDCP